MTQQQQQEEQQLPAAQQQEMPAEAGAAAHAAAQAPAEIQEGESSDPQPDAAGHLARRPKRREAERAHAKISSALNLDETPKGRPKPANKGPARGKRKAQRRAAADPNEGAGDPGQEGALDGPRRQPENSVTAALHQAVDAADEEPLKKKKKKKRKTPSTPRTAPKSSGRSSDGSASIPATGAKKLKASASSLPEARGPNAATAKKPSAKKSKQQAKIKKKSTSKSKSSTSSAGAAHGGGGGTKKVAASGPKAAVKVGKSFKVGDKVLGLWGYQLYDAEVLHTDEVANQYFVHYLGWRTNWDEWLDASRVYPMNEASEQLRAELAAEFKAQRGSKKRKQAPDALGHGSNRSSSSSSGGNGATVAASGGAQANGHGKVQRTLSKKAAEAAKQGRVDPALEVVENYSALYELSGELKLPMAVKMHLTRDWELITKHNKLLRLPRKPSVRSILADFVAHQREEKLGARDLLAFEEMCHGLSEYFERALGKALLYRFERVQYDRLRLEQGPGVKLGDTYGVEHLMRLVLKIPHLMAGTESTTAQIEAHMKRLQSLLQFIVKNKEKYVVMLDAYQDASDDYKAEFAKQTTGYLGRKNLKKRGAGEPAASGGGSIAAADVDAVID